MICADSKALTVTITNPFKVAKVPAGNLMVSGTWRDNDGDIGVNNVPVQVDSGPYVTAKGTTR
jgi:hypothetical protein